MSLKKQLRALGRGVILNRVRGNTHVRVHHRGNHRRQLHRGHRIALPLMLLAGAAHAMPPLMPATDVAQVGLIAWWRCVSKMWQGSPVSDLRLSVELCTSYWHYLLLIWLVVFGLLLIS